MEPEAGSKGGSTFRAMAGALRARRAAADPRVEDAHLEAALTMAAVSSQFDPDELVDRLPGAQGRELLAKLKPSCATVPQDGRRLWMMLGEARKGRLRALAASGNLRRAVREERVGADDDLAKTLRAYVEGTAKPLTDQTADELANSNRILSWLDGSVDALPERRLIEAASAYRELLRPLEMLAGPDTRFSGRQAELEALRSFIDRDRRSGIDAGGGSDLSGEGVVQPAARLAVTGVGGAGKSALLAKVILERTTHSGMRLPFAYLDFDRPSLAPDEPGDLLLEAMRQLACQDPDRKHRLEAAIERLREGYIVSRSDMVEEVGGSATAGHPMSRHRMDPRLPPIVRAFSDAVESAGSRPFLLVLDTVEEAEHRSLTQLEALRDALRLVQEIIPDLRVIVSGRSPSVLGAPAEEIHLGDLDHRSATDYLSKTGLSNDDAAAVARRIGGLPLALRLAVSLIEADGLAASGIKELDAGPFWRRFDRSRVLGQLYARVLDHIHDDAVRQIAHPGLIVRIITPEVIRIVIAPVLGLNIDVEEARLLYGKLAEERALIVDEGDHLRHRRDLRAETLVLMHQDKPDVARKVHAAAAAYWEGLGDGARERAEAIYHRIWLEEPFETIEKLWIPEVVPLLRSATEELPVRGAEMVRVLSGDTAGISASNVSVAERRVILQSRIAEELRRDNPEAALDILADVPEAHSEDFFLFLKADALKRLYRWDQAVSVLGRVPETSSIYSAACLSRCELLFGMGRVGQIHEVAERGGAVAARDGDTSTVFEFAIWALACARMAGNLASVDRLVGDAARAYFALGEGQRRKLPQTLRRYACLAGDRDSNAVAAFYLHADINDLSAAEKSTLSQALADWDRRTSERVGAPSGLLARQSGVDVGAERQLDLDWARFVGEASPERLAALMPALLKRHTFKREDARAFADLIRFRYPEWRFEASRVLAAAFPDRDDLLAFAGRTLAASPSELPEMDAAEGTEAAIVRWADAEGLLPVLLRAAAEGRSEQPVALIAAALDRWVAISDWSESRSREAAETAAPARRTAAPGVDLFELVKKFYQAPFAERVRIAEDLGLIDPSERQMDAALLCRLILQRAKEKGLLGRLADRLFVI